ncbi:hypothetical protein Agabi119p4_7159 [Agaricus bisporus var. burnettii]|uniref:Uncharacterized protein n=1 Tax=Agaricus bisporus var. burnettii TaxID=192524 RepID=A0A8H7EYR5_AGABI|nr:hypothetical protein Agabi119p4_7159 [Agaricus bisporus var. burnettii]
MSGHTYEVTWDTSKAPKQITNRKGRIILAFKTRLVGLSSPLAQDFDILLGKFNVTVPKNTAPGKDYQLVLMGDSGNYGPKFSIVA